MAIEVSWLTRHETHVLREALADYRDKCEKQSRRARGAQERAYQKGHAYTAGDLIRQLAER